MNTFTYIFLAMLILATGVQLWLSRRQIRHVSAHRDTVPRAFSDKISGPAHRKAADYTLSKVRFGMGELVFGAAVLLLWTLAGGLQLLLDLWQQTGLGAMVQGIGFILSVFLIGGLLDVPFSAYRTFVIEQRFGFNRTTVGIFLGDMLKQGLLTLAIGVPLAALVLWLMGNAGELWWLYVWAVWMAFGLLMMWAFPAFIAPLFNRFSPLEDETLETRIRRLLERCGFQFNGVFVMDGSRRSAHGNAYFSGLGNNKRIVFFDTLLQHLSPDEIEAVLAHELGHFRRRHVRKRFALMAVSSLAGLAILGWLIDRTWFYQGLGVAEPSIPAALVLFLLIAPVFTFFIQPLMARSMRKREFEADEFAAEQSDAGDLIRALVKLYEENASTLTPDPLYSAFHDSHPPAPIRISHLKTRMQTA